ncbi:3-hydroxyacyl-CoA dehydrogenase NAD-binding domain-containing protein [Bordetella hinzii]|uniref:3-hydroxyacyl-CoA dehydrogenase n=1 Tax=Bordetella hinzii TaxID=103855 RepID=A0AAN1RZ21_9BORD|nr:3-hydroxyacyl-CoA dehydrogenase NAD-binding domain-containing protein [Bordetella hinzii]AKQ60186.1 Fatty acid oxidation complex subunit alpha [Bordetella hinzii]AZW18737.1 3-hydroxyacyl-CoA dehydrogenase [Bordetella hinzii]MBZ0081568.1 enoyl-CoA hydratase/isomerase family protein [Bordetella hinzii]MBZ0085843.1 enoyl-CoA hydratase/isomerase family protein [Bordetella hinzii]QDJ52341.1 hypothetical protein CBR69_19460 [Bordetella hinzii]
MIDYRRDDDGVAHIVWNNPEGEVNIKNAASMAAFVAAVDGAIADPAVKGVVIASAKRDFLAGGDLNAVYAAATPAEAIANVREIGQCLRRMETCGKPFVAAINGSALGGGLELALACHHRIAADAPRARLGLPEVTLGLIPGCGGTQRLPRLIGIAPAARLMLAGQALPVDEAARLGVIDQVVAPGALAEVARDWVLAHPQARQPWDAKSFRYPDFEPQSREGRWFFFYEWPKLRRKTPAGDLAPGVLLHVLGQGLERGIDAGLAIEARYFGMVAASASAKNRIRTQFFATTAVRKQQGRPSGEPVFEARRAGVVGAGLMGGGIALVCAQAGIETVLLDASAEHAERGKQRIADSLEAAVTRGRMTARQRQDILARIQAAGDYAALKGCDVVLEAVLESIEVKAEVFGKIRAHAGEEVLIASNTSTLSISGLARGQTSPGRFIGLHFFAPVERMALVEVILGKQTSRRSQAEALDFLKQIRKTPVVANDGPGFFTSRVVAAYTREALIMLQEGLPPALIDNAAVSAGMPIGPLAMADLTSYDLLADIFASLARTGLGTARESAGALEAARRLVAAGRSGRKRGAGVYDYAGTVRTPWNGCAGLFPPAAQLPALEEVQQRLLNIQSLETLHAMDEGVVASPLEIDLASVLGWGYPAWRGGVLGHIDATGPQEFLRQCEALAERHGERFRAPASLRARADTRFHAQ